MVVFNLFELFNVDENYRNLTTIYMKTKRLKWLVVFLVGLTGCYDYSNFDNIVVDPTTSSFVFPIINDTITLKEILEKSDSISFIQENPDHSFSLLFRDTIDAGFASNQFSIPNQNFDYNLTVPGIPAIPVPAQTFTFDQESTNSITTTTDAGATVELKGIDFSSGTIQIHVVNNFHHTIDGTITFLSLLSQQNKELTLKFNLNDYGSTKDTTINLVDYHLNSYYAATDNYNYFYYNIKGTLTTLNNPVNPGDNLSIQVQALNPMFKRITGKILYSFVQDNQSLNVDFFPNNLDIQQHFEDPKLKLNFINSYGIPSSVSFTQFQIDNKQHVPFNLTSSRSLAGDLQVPNIANSISPIKRIDQPDTSTIFVLNRDNSNIKDAFDNTPTAFNFGAKFDLGENTNNHDYFINYESTIKLIAEAEIPIYGWVTLNMTDSIMSLDLPKLDSIDGIEVESVDISLVLKTLNSIPCNVSLQADFINESTGDTTKLLTNEQLILSPTVGLDGISNQVASNTTTININKEKYDLFSNATKLKYYLHFKIGDTGQNVKVLSTNKLGIKANLYISGKYKPII